MLDAIKKIFGSQTCKRWIKNLMLISLLLTISAVGFCGFFMKWSFRDDPGSQFGFVAMMENTANRPFIHRQLYPVVVKSTVEMIPQRTRDKLSARLIEKQHIERRFAKAHIPEKYVLEYYVMFSLCFLSFFAAICILRSLLCKVTSDKVAGTLGAMLFALIFPYFEVLGGYYYDIGEVLFMFMAANFAVRGKVIALLILAPIATWNKESFFFFLATLYPLTRQYFNTKKSAAITLGSIFLAGLAYLYVREMFAGNPGDAADGRLIEHFENLFDIKSYFLTDSIYGVPLLSRVFFLHVIYVIFIVKTSWNNLSKAWKTHAKIAAVINGALYFLFVVPGELRDLSMLYTSLMILTSYFIRGIFIENYSKKET